MSETITLDRIGLTVRYAPEDEWPIHIIADGAELHMCRNGAFLLAQALLAKIVECDAAKERKQP